MIKPQKKKKKKGKGGWKTNEMSRKSEVDSTFPIYAQKNDSLIHFSQKRQEFSV